MTTPGPTPGPWVEVWLSPARHGRFLATAAGDPALALRLYEWDAEVSAALHHDLGHLEVGLRNAYDRALTRRWPGPPHWTAAHQTLFPPLYRTRSHGRVDINDRPRRLLRDALQQAGVNAPSGKVVAELTFGFWRYLSSAAHEKTLWVPALHTAFPTGTDRGGDVDAPIARLHKLRNRVAHHEPLLAVDLLDRLNDATQIAALIDQTFGAHLLTTSMIPTLARQRPS